MNRAAALCVIVLLGAFDGAQASGEVSAAAAAASKASIPFKQDAMPAADVSGRVLAALAACTVAGAAGIYFLRRRLVPGALRPRIRRLQVVETHRLGPKSTAVLLRWDDEELLLVQSENNASLVAKRGSSGHQKDQSRS